MIHELTSIQIQPGKQKDFEAAVAQGIEKVIRHSKGYIRYNLNHSLAKPEHYLLHIEWETLENHMVDFRESPAFPEWRGYISAFFAEAPSTEHFETVTTSA